MLECTGLVPILSDGYVLETVYGRIHAPASWSSMPSLSTVVHESVGTCDLLKVGTRRC